VSSERGIRVLLLSRDEALHGRVAAALATSRRYDLLQRTSDLEDAYALGAEGILSLVLLDRRLSGDDELAPVRELKQRLVNADIVVVSGSDDSEYIRRALLVGARAFLPYDFSPDSLVQTLDDLSDGDLQHAGGRSGRGASHMVAVAAIKGGVGRTLLATNLAVAIREATHQPVVLVDGQFLYGDTEIDLNLSPQHSIADLVGQVGSLEREVLDEALVHHASGLRVLAATDSPADLSRITPESVTGIVRGLKKHYPWVIVDTGNWMDERLDSLLEMADLVLLVATPEMTALRAARLFLQMTRESDYPENKVRLVLNRADLLGGVPGPDIERSLGLGTYASLCDDGALVAYSINRGVPLVISHPRKPLARQITRIAADLVKELAPLPEAKSRFRLFGRLANRMAK
jgi:pilus assembly protein CpaE